MSYYNESQKLWKELETVNKNELNLASQANFTILEERVMKAEEEVRQVGKINNDLCGRVNYLKRKDGELTKKLLYQKAKKEAVSVTLMPITKDIAQLLKCMKELC